MDLTSVEIQHKQFHTRWRGFDPREVELFIGQMTEELQQARVEISLLRKELQGQEKELKEHREREKTIRNVLVNVQKTVEGMKANAEKEAKLIVAEAELKAERVLQEAHSRLAQLQEGIAELKRHRVQLENKFRSTLENYLQMLNMDSEDDIRESEPEAKVKLLNRQNP